MPAQRLCNLRNSQRELGRLLKGNFRDGAQLVTLNYWDGARAPSRKMAALQLCDWLRAARNKHGPGMRYIRATEAGEGYSVHRVVLRPSGVSAASLAALWEYGPVTVEPVQADGLENLAKLMMGPALNAGRVVVPCGRTWSTSKGLSRSGDTTDSP